MNESVTRPLAPGRVAVRKDPRHRNPEGWAVVSNEPIPSWIGRRRIEGEHHAGLYAYVFKSWHSAVLRAQREAARRKVRVTLTVVKSADSFGA